jgi:hypothetical protein
VLMLGDDMHSDIAGAQEAGLIAWAVETGSSPRLTRLRAGITPDRIIPGPRRAHRGLRRVIAAMALCLAALPFLVSRCAAQATEAQDGVPVVQYCRSSRGHRRHERDRVHRQHRERAARAHARQGGGARGAPPDRACPRTRRWPPRRRATSGAGHLPRCDRRHRAERQRPHPARGDEGRLEHLPDLRHHHGRRAVGGGDWRGRGQSPGARSPPGWSAYSSNPDRRRGSSRSGSRARSAATSIVGAVVSRNARRPLHPRPGGTPVLLPSSRWALGGDAVYFDGDVLVFAEGILTPLEVLSRRSPWCGSTARAHSGPRPGIPAVGSPHNCSRTPSSRVPPPCRASTTTQAASART